MLKQGEMTQPVVRFHTDRPSIYETNLHFWVSKIFFFEHFGLGILDNIQNWIFHECGLTVPLLRFLTIARKCVPDTIILH